MYMSSIVLETLDSFKKHFHGLNALLNVSFKYINIMVFVYFAHSNKTCVCHYFVLQLVNALIAVPRSCKQKSCFKFQFNNAFNRRWWNRLFMWLPRVERFSAISLQGISWSAGGQDD